MFMMPGHLNYQLHKAVRNGKLDTARLLIHRGAEINSLDTERNSALHIAVENANGHLDVINFLLKYGAHIDIRDKDGCTPFLIAVRNRDLVVVKELIKCGANVDNWIHTHSMITPLHIAILNLDTVIIEAIAKKSKFLNCSTFCSDLYPLPLYTAVESGNLKAIRILINAGAEVDVRFRRGKTPLHYAVQQRLNSDDYRLGDSRIKNMFANGFIEYPLDILKELILCGAKINASSDLGKTPFCIAVKRYKVDPMCTRTLIKYTVLKYDVDYKTIISLDTCKKQYYDAVSKYINECAYEVAQMKKFILNSQFSLFDIASKRTQPDNLYRKYSKAIVDQILMSLYDNKFPIYYDVLSAATIRSDLVTKLLECKIYAVSNMHEGNPKIVVLDQDCLYGIVIYLPNSDLKNLVTIFYKLHNRTSEHVRNINVSPFCIESPNESFSDNCFKRAKLI